VYEVHTSIANIGFANIHDRLVDRNFPRRRLLGQQENNCQISWAGWLGAAKLADRHNRFFSKREVLTGPELNRFDLLRTIDTVVSIEGIVEGAHATFLRLLRPPRRGVKAAKNSFILTFPAAMPPAISLASSRWKATVGLTRAGGMVVVKFGKTAVGSRFISERIYHRLGNPAIHRRLS
jgi:hypothetical protein